MDDRYADGEYERSDFQRVVRKDKARGGQHIRRIKNAYDEFRKAPRRRRRGM